jgi:hypothetical protein
MARIIRLRASEGGVMPPFVPEAAMLLTTFELVALRCILLVCFLLTSPNGMPLRFLTHYTNAQE